MQQIRIPGMLLIGSAGRNVGKTDLACRVISRFKDRDRIVGLKVTTVHDTSGVCPRGGDGCGICKLQEEAFSIHEETDPSSAKDTGRLLAAGADSVLWLRVLEPELEAGAAALFRELPKNQPTICESNSLRLVVVPDLFLMVKSASESSVKPSAGQVSHMVDRWVISDGERFDMDIGTVCLDDGRWHIVSRLPDPGKSLNDTTATGYRSLVPNDSL